MIYLQKSRSPKNRTTILLIVAVVLVIALIFILEAWSGRVLGRFALSVGGPVASAYLAVSDNVTYLSGFINSRTSLIDENRRLKEEIREQSEKVATYDSLFQEHQNLLTAYGRRPVDTATVLANVVVKPPQSPYDVIVVDVGSADGVNLGARVYGVGGVPIGRVSEVARSTSKVVLFSSNGEETPGVLESSGSTVIVSGTGGGNMESKLPPETEVFEGDRIILPDFNGVVMAEVVEIDSNKTSASKRILLRAPVNVFNLRFVQVQVIN